MVISLLIGFILGAAAIVFIIQNNVVVALTFLGWQFESSLAVVVFLSILVGALIAALMFLPGSIGSSMRIGGLKRENKRLHEETERYKQTAAEAAMRLNAAQPSSDYPNP